MVYGSFGDILIASSPKIIFLYLRLLSPESVTSGAALSKFSSSNTLVQGKAVSFLVLVLGWLYPSILAVLREPKEELSSRYGIFNSDAVF